MKHAALGNLHGKHNGSDNTHEQRLWQRVLISAARDIQNRPQRRMDRLECDDSWWIKSRDFEDVCDLAGVHAETARRRFIEMIDQ